ncbi:phage tail protein [Lacihabitans sp. LS3-19]|uniref:phage tail protein n=1 Tax=Lacihabitans sp. LS3-19 TaxID=2487335 RepID=UPI0020CDCFD1|nr:tail fiber protein [Lacihabitans sp. LS3-19]MCP9769230.1 phage tail protein [Lacihabitans sp. LS3-19]
MDPLIAEIKLFGGNFAPRGWAYCDGQLLSIASNQALFSILGTTYGGDGRTTFALPDLRGRAPIAPGTGPGLTNHQLGQRGGTETNTLNVTNLPAHTHSMNASNDTASSGSPASNSLGTAARGGTVLPYAPGAANQVAMGSTTGSAGGNIPFNNMQPYLALNYIIALVGIFPSRN